MRVLGVNAVFHDPAAALVVDGVTVAAAEEERFNRRKHGKDPLAFSAWELPELAARWCLEHAGLEAGDLDAVAYSYDPELAPANGESTRDPWEGLRTIYTRRAPLFLRTALPGLDPAKVRFVPHHVAHAASAHLSSPYESSTVMVLDGRGERGSYLGARYRGRTRPETLKTQELPHSLGLLYEEATDHLGFRRSSDEYKVMALASYGEPDFLDTLRAHAYLTADGGFRTEPVDWEAIVPRRGTDDDWGAAHAALAASVQRLLEELLLGLARWLHERTGDRALTMAGGVALNCVANSLLWRESPFEEIWVQPAAGDSGTALGAALHVAAELGDEVEPMGSAALGRSWTDEELGDWLRGAGLTGERPPDAAEEVAEIIANDGIVAWFEGRSEFGPRALGHRSLLANAAYPANLERLNEVKGREQFRPVAPMVLLERAGEIFTGGPIPSPHMLFTHDVRPEWLDRIPAVVHVDGSARIQTVDRREEPLVAAILEGVERRTGVPVVVNTSLNTAGRPMVDDPRDALECFGSAPVEVLVLGPYLVRRPALAVRRPAA
jgi:carbamoyltransferase